MGKGWSVPPSLRTHQNSKIYSAIWRIAHLYNGMFSAVICGKRGKGKSWAAISFAWNLDVITNREDGTDTTHRFTIDRVCFSPSQFSDLLNQNLPKGSVIILDEAGLALYSREAMTKIVRELAKLLQTIRYKNYILLFCLPNFGMLDSNARQLMDAFIQLKYIDRNNNHSIAKWHWIRTDNYTGFILRKRPTIKEKRTYSSGAEFETETFLNEVRFEKAPEELLIAYEKRKKEFLNSRTFEVHKGLLSLEHTGGATTKEEELDIEAIKLYAKANPHKFLNAKGQFDKDLLALKYPKPVAIAVSKLLEAEKGVNRRA